MTLQWVHEPSPVVWDTDKERVIGGAPEGAFVLPFDEGDHVPGEWWHVRDDDGRIVGYGRLDTTWGGDAEVLLATEAGRQGEGIGSFILAHLEDEAAHRGVNYVFNLIRDHDQREHVYDWLTAHGFQGRPDGDLRKRVSTLTPA